jgi:V8-like Glu-specific endopeptidase
VGCSWYALSAARVPIRLAECLETPLAAEDAVHAIQYHQGGKHLSIQLVASIKGPVVSYVGDTLPGSSGSPVFKHWRLVAIHDRGAR